MEFFHKETTFPFMHTRRVWYGVSGVALIASIVLLLVHGLSLGIDFTGGVELEFAFPEKANIEHTRQALEKVGYADASVQQFGGEHSVLVRLQLREKQDENAASVAVTDALKALDPGVELSRKEVVSAQVGKELSEKGGLAVLFTFILIGLYTAFRFQWKLGLSAVAATLHDPIIILGFFAVTGITFDLSVLAAILAVIGYSLNDTVVVFDRVRENFRSMRKKRTPEEIMDASINQTLSRTIITSGATLLVVIVLLLVGGGTLKGFSWALTIGIVVGTYSSIYVAGALALEMKVSAADLMEEKTKDTSELDAVP